MSAPNKNGLDYFPHDVDMSNDQKIEYLEATCGIVGYAIYLKLLEKIYRLGYYMRWSERDAFIFSKHNNIEVNVCNNSINVCINEGLFCNNLYEKYHILTSKSIQKRYFSASSRRKNLRIIEQLFLLNRKESEKLYKNLVLVNINSINVDINPINVDINSVNVGQSKVKESKEKVKERKNILSGRPDAVPYEKIIDHLNSKIGSNFQHTTKETRRLIDARWNSGFRLEDFYYVIDIKAHNWLNDEKMRPFLRPCTLFGTKFESYRNERPKCKQPGLLKFLQKEGVFDEQE